MSDDVLNELRKAEAFMDQAETELARLRSENQRLREAIRRLADQDATLSVQGGNVIVTMDATLTDAEREAVDRSQKLLDVDGFLETAATLRGLLERTKGCET